MRDLVGQCFNLADGRYRIVDVRQLGGDAMVYAELLEPGGSSEGTAEPGRPAAAGRPGRTAFHFADIASMLPAERFA